MSATTIDIDVMRAVDGEELVSSLTARGLKSMLIDTGDRVHVRISDGRSSSPRFRANVTDMIDTWIAEQDFPLILTPIDEGLVLHPPGD